METRIVLDEKDFRALVRGAVVDKTAADGRRVYIILSDIGWLRMDCAITDAMEAASKAGERNG